MISLFVPGCGSAKSIGENTESITATTPVTIDGFTLLERTYADTDSDGTNEIVELYTSAEKIASGRIGWDTGHQWVLLVRKGEETFPLFNDRLQYGELQYWIVSFNKDNIQSPETTDLEKRIYVSISTDLDFRLFNYYWDKQNHSYTKEVMFNPQNQWGVRHFNQYNIPDPDRIEVEPANPL
ncbi:hypothetical protein [Syntrophobotulus glycolicus]|nr:hypothetical protein [Syntrophobotulus glycolicus]